jgi:hypothetical protein
MFQNNASLLTSFLLNTHTQNQALQRGNRFLWNGKTNGQEGLCLIYLRAFKFIHGKTKYVLLNLKLHKGK